MMLCRDGVQVGRFRVTWRYGRKIRRWLFGFYWQPYDAPFIEFPNMTLFIGPYWFNIDAQMERKEAPDAE